MMLHRVIQALSLALICGCLAQPVAASQIVDGKLESKLVPSPVEFAVLLPDGYETAKEPLPLLLFLHGGNGDKSFLTNIIWCAAPITSGAPFGLARWKGWDSSRACSIRRRPTRRWKRRASGLSR